MQDLTSPIITTSLNTPNMHFEDCEPIIELRVTPNEPSFSSKNSLADL